MAPPNHTLDSVCVSVSVSDGLSETIITGDILRLMGKWQNKHGCFCHYHKTHPVQFLFQLYKLLTV